MIYAPVMEEDENKYSLKENISFVWIYFVMPFITVIVLSGIERRLMHVHYFKADIDEFGNSIEPYNGHITFILVVIIVLFMFFMNIKKTDFSDIKGTLRRAEDKFIGYTTALIFVAFISYLTVDSVITRVSLVLNRIHNVDEIQREYDSYFFYDYERMELAVGHKSWETIKIEESEWEKVKNNECITLVFSVGWLGIPHSPALLTENSKSSDM